MAQVGLNVRPSNPTCVAPARPLTGTAAIVDFPVIFGVGDQPTAMQRSPVDPTLWFVSIKGGLIRRVTWDPSHPTSPRPTVTTVCDLTDRVIAGTESGLEGMVFHPGFPNPPYVYVHYSGQNAPGVAPGPFTEYISRFTSRDGGLTIDPSSEQVVLALPQHGPNHHGGKLVFGPDGYLYVGFGDGGIMAESLSQSLSGWYGKLLRIDVDHGQPYTVPPDNLFAAGGGAPEIFAWGLRNPYQFSFDRLTGDLWVGDVGFDTWEEVDRVVRGGNYGWPVMEGDHCVADPCDTTGFLPPVVEHLHADLGGDGLAIMGGYVYRGAAIPELQGRYVYGDLDGNVWALEDDGFGNQVPELLRSGIGGPTGVYEDAQGELYFLTSPIRALVRSTASTTGAPFPQTLSATGCRSPGNTTQPAGGMIPYGVNVELWSDGAAKSRWMGVPDRGTITIDPDGDWEFPVGTILMKDFVVQGQLTETRLLMRHPDGGWAGYSYQWNASLTDATLLQDAATRVVGGQTWQYPSPSQCLRCHTVIAGGSLGPTTPQMNRTWVYPATGRTGNQIDTLAAIGMFAPPAPPPSSQLPVLPGPNTPGFAPELQARGYLQANCAHCHAPGGLTEADIDLRWETADADMNLCGRPPDLGDLGVPGALLLAPGDPLHSIVSLRMHALDANRMPPLATSIVDPLGTLLVDAWIVTHPACVGVTTSTVPATTTTSSTATTSTTTRVSTTTTTSTTTRSSTTARSTTTTRTSTTSSSTATTTTRRSTSTTTTTLAAPITVTFRSIGAEDGTLGESTPRSGVGGPVIARSGYMQVGDRANHAQSKILASFDTSTLAGATIVSATLRLNRVGLVRTNPFSTLGRLLADVQTGGFGGSPTLQPGDFQATATAPGAASMSNPTTNGSWSTGTLTAAGLAAINPTGRTQVRFAFEVHDDGNGTADRISFATGDNADPTLWPALDVTYVPASTRGPMTVTETVPTSVMRPGRLFATTRSSAARAARSP